MSEYWLSCMEMKGSIPHFSVGQIVFFYPHVKRDLGRLCMRMNAATALSCAAAATQLVLAGLSMAFAVAPGWKHLRVFAFISLSAVGLSLCELVLQSSESSNVAVLWAARLRLSMAYVHVALWVHYIPLQYGEEKHLQDRRLAGVLAVAALLSATPGVIFSNTVRSHVVPWAELSYRAPEFTALGSWLMTLLPLALLAPTAAFVRKARQGEQGSRVHALGFLVLLGTTTNDVLVASDIVNGLYLGVLGITAAVLSICWEMAHRVTRDAHRLRRVSDELSAEVQTRTAELAYTRDQLARADRLAALGQLSASVGHEINNPLSYVMGNLEYIRGELALGDSSNQPLREALTEAFTGAERIRRIVSELRQFSRVPGSELDEVVDVHSVLQASLKLAQGALEGGVRVEVDYASVACVRADPTKLSQVFLNLLINAVQASRENCPPGDEPVLVVRTRALPNMRVCVEILDTGPGVSPQEQDRVFEPFFSTKTEDKGTGLGLFISLGIVTSLGGSIELVNRDEGGICARVELPGCDNETTRAQSSRPPMSHVVACVRPQRLLIVDDDVLVARSLARQLREYSVDVLAGGQAALDRLGGADSESYDWILCDLMMPGLTGMEVYERVVETQPELAQRFIFISGGGATERCRLFAELHNDRILTKPIDPRKLEVILVSMDPRPSRPAIRMG